MGMYTMLTPGDMQGTCEKCSDGVRNEDLDQSACDHAVCAGCISSADGACPLCPLDCDGEAREGWTVLETTTGWDIFAPEDEWATDSYPERQEAIEMTHHYGRRECPPGWRVKLSDITRHWHGYSANGDNVTSSVSSDRAGCIEGLWVAFGMLPEEFEEMGGWKFDFHRAGEDQKR